VGKTRIGFVGVGNMGQCAHLKNYASLRECEVVAIAELRETLGAKVAARYGVPRVYRTHDAMLSKEQLDGIVASQMFTRHGQLVPALVSAGIPVFIEKPLASSVEVGEEILNAVKKSGTWLMVGYHKRSDPATQYAKSEIDRVKGTGELGRLKYIRLTMPSGDWIAGGFDDLITSDEPMPVLATDPRPPDMNEETFNRYVGFVNYYIHQVNLMRHLLGESYRVTHADASGALLVGESNSGVACSIEMSPYRTTVDWQESALVCFERGYVKIDLPAPLATNRPGRVDILRDPGDGQTPESIVPQIPWVHAMRQQAANFLAAVRGEQKPPCGAAEALEDLRVARDYLRLSTP